jgi:dipeptidase E
VRAFLASGGVRSPEQIESFCRRMREAFGGGRTVLVIPFASGKGRGGAPPPAFKDLLDVYRFETIDQPGDPRRAIEAADAIFVPGGNTFRLLDALYAMDLVDTIRQKVAGGTPYMGASAGSNIACPTIQTTNDMPIVQPPRLDALGLVPFQINPHYYPGRAFYEWDGTLRPHNGETRDERIAEFHQLHDRPVIGMWEASLLRCVDGEVWLEDGPARLFRVGREPMDVLPGTRVDPLL